MNNSIKNTIKQFFKTRTYRKIYVGFSGGLDSTCLLYLLNSISRETGFEITAVHFEHGLRGALSIADAKWCEEFCSKHSIKYIEYSFNMNCQSNNGNTEALARKLRYQKFKELIKNKNEEAVALGHHRGDKVENLFIRLFRGANSSGLTSLKKETELYGLKIIRPMIDVSKKDMESFLKNNGIDDCRVDHTNKDSKYRRNFFRNEILPAIYKKIPNAEISLDRTIDVLTDDANYLEQAAKEKYNILKSRKEINIDFLSTMHTAILIRVLRYWLSDNLNFEFIPDRNFVNRIKNEIKKDSTEKKLIPVKNNNFLCIRNNKLSIYSKIETFETVYWNWKTKPEMTVGKYKIKADLQDKSHAEFNKSVNGTFFDSSLLPDTLIVRPCRKGDRIIPFSKTSPVKLKKAFTDRKISAEIKKSIPLMCLSDNTIIWILGIRRSNYASISKNTKQIVKFIYTNE